MKWTVTAETAWRSGEMETTNERPGAYWVEITAAAFSKGFHWLTAH